MEVNEILHEIGLNEYETKVYLGLLKRGSSLASSISNETKLNRSFVYQILTKLIEKGFVSYVIKENRKYFNVVSADKLLDLLKEREDKLKSILPQLKSLEGSFEKKPVVEIFEGREGIKTVLKDIINIRRDWYSLGSSGKATEIIPFYVEHWEKERVNNKIKLKAMMDKSDSGIKRGKELAKLKYTEIKYINEKLNNPSSTWIYGDRVVVIFWSKENSFAIRTINQEIATSYINYFNTLWKNAKK